MVHRSYHVEMSESVVSIAGPVHFNDMIDRMVPVSQILLIGNGPFGESSIWCDLRSPELAYTCCAYDSRGES
jgi:hypothetical protein